MMPVEFKKADWLRYLKTLGDMITLVKRNRIAFQGLIGIVWFWFYTAAIMTFLVPYTRNVLRTGQLGFALAVGSLSMGLAFGSWLSRRLTDRKFELGLVPLGTLGMAFFAMDLWFLDPPSLHVLMVNSGVSSVSTIPAFLAGMRLLIDIFALSAFAALFRIPLSNLVLEQFDAESRGRFISASYMINTVFALSGGLFTLAVLSSDLSPANTLFAALTILHIGVTVYMFSRAPEFPLRFFAWVMANIAFALRVEGHDAIPDEGAAVLVCNQITPIDWLLISAAVKRPIRFVINDDLADHNPLKFFFRQANVIRTDRTRDERDFLQGAHDKVEAALRAGELVCVFPEAIPTRTGALNPFIHGIETIIKHAAVPVIPMALQGLWQSQFSYNNANHQRIRWLFRVPARLRIGAALLVDGGITTTDIIFRKVQWLKSDDDPLNPILPPENDKADEVDAESEWRAAQ